MLRIGNEEIYYKNYTPEQLLEEVKKINYKHNKEILDSDDRDSLLTSSNQYRLRYHYREFKFDMDPLKKTSQSLNTGFNI